MMTRPFILCLTVCVIVVVAPVAAQQPAPAGQADSPIPATYEERLRTGSPAEVEVVIEELRQKLAASDGSKMGEHVRRYELLSILLSQKKQDAVLELTELGLMAETDSAKSLAYYLRTRMDALQDQGKTDEALAEGKRLYNVVPMEETADAVLRIARLLKDSGPNGESRLDQFKQEQMAGVEPPASLGDLTKPRGTDHQASVLGKIVLPDAGYARAAEEIHSRNNFRLLTSKGNLLLLAGEPEKAMQAFEDAYEIAGDKDVQMASENIARGLRALDGTIGRANAFVKSIQPKPAPAKATAPTPGKGS